MSEQQQLDKQPDLHVLNPRTAPLAQIFELFRKLKGRQPTPEEVAGYSFTARGCRAVA
jgi:hypothetical protein